MAKKEELRQYAISFKEKHGRLPEVERFKKDMIIMNALDTGDDKPDSLGIISSWLEYWQAFANCDGNDSIPEPADAPTECSAKETPKGDNFEERHEKHIKSENLDGAHVLINEGEKPYDKFYIVPLCHSCNCLYCKEIELKEGTILVEVVESEKNWEERIKKFKTTCKIVKKYHKINTYCEQRDKKK